MLNGRHYRTGKGVALRLKGGRIEKVGAGRGKPWIAPGLVDVQINGFRGMDFNTLPVPEELPGRVTRELWKEGVTSYLPTVITNAPEAIEEAVRAVARSCERDRDAAAGIAGVHVEGPFISGEDGPRGAHDRRHVRPPDWALVERWQAAADGRIRVLTMSPEYPGSADFVRRCAAAGIAVSIGHTAASPEQIREAVAAGATMSTHLGNGAHLTLARHPNYIWEQLAADELMTCIIPDGFHLPDAVVKVMIRARGERIMLASDAVYLSGLAPGEYATHVGGKVVLTAEGRLHLAENPGILAGSAQMILHGVARLARRGIAELADLWEMASTRPASFLGLAAGKGLRAGAPADLVAFDWKGEGIDIGETWKGGRKVYERGE